MRLPCAPGPAYYPSPKGCEFLAEHFEDHRYLTTPTQTPQAHHIHHWLAVSETHFAIDQAVAAQDSVSIEGWINEWDVVNKEESRPEKRFKLFTLIRENPRLVAAPDGAFLLSMKGHRKVFYLEQDRNTSGVRQIAASKTPGYAEMLRCQLQRRHFPEATVDGFSGIRVTTTDNRRRALQQAIADKPGADVWRFTTVPALTPESFLHTPIFYHCKDQEPRALVKGQ